jgi:hypothetical protein
MKEIAPSIPFTSKQKYWPVQENGDYELTQIQRHLENGGINKVNKRA